VCVCVCVCVCARACVRICERVLLHKCTHVWMVCLLACARAFTVTGGPHSAFTVTGGPTFPLTRNETLGGLSVMTLDGLSSAQPPPLCTVRGPWVPQECPWVPQECPWVPQECLRCPRSAWMLPRNPPLVLPQQPSSVPVYHCRCITSTPTRARACLPAQARPPCLFSNPAPRVAACACEGGAGEAALGGPSSCEVAAHTSVRLLYISCSSSFSPSPMSSSSSTCMRSMNSLRRCMCVQTRTCILVLVRAHVHGALSLCVPSSYTITSEAQASPMHP